MSWYRPAWSGAMPLVLALSPADEDAPAEPDETAGAGTRLRRFMVRNQPVKAVDEQAAVHWSEHVWRDKP